MDADDHDDLLQPLLDTYSDSRDKMNTMIVKEQADIKEFVLSSTSKHGEIAKMEFARTLQSVRSPCEEQCEFSKYFNNKRLRGGGEGLRLIFPFADE